MRRKVSLFCRFSVLIFSVLELSFAQAQTVYTPVAVTGFTDDVVANIPGPANQSATNDMDGGNAPTRFCFLTQNYRNPSGAAPQTFLPASGRFTSADYRTPGLVFQLADYNSNNTLRIKGIGSGTLTFTTPRAARVIYLLGGSGNSLQDPTNFAATINFTDGTTQIFPNLFFMDWFGLLDVVALQGVSRVNYDTNVIENSTINPSLYQKQLVILPANYGKNIQSISFVKPAAFGTLNILAVTAGSGCTTAPGGGKAVASVSNICSPTNVDLSLTGSATDPELNYQWQYSVNNGLTWTDIPGANSKIYTVKPAQTTQYRARLICGSLNGTSAAVTVTLTIPKVTVAYPNTDYCQISKTEVPAVSPKGGSFSGSEGLIIDQKTGVIDLEASTPGEHTITYSSTGQCPEKATTLIRIEASPKPVFPNIITPNNDGLNDEFLVKLPTVSEYKMRIYNRWGNLVWDNPYSAIGWPGGNDGVYYYFVQFKDCAGKKHTYKGWVEVVH